MLGDNALLIRIQMLEGDAGAARYTEIRIISEF